MVSRTDLPPCSPSSHSHHNGHYHIPLEIQCSGVVLPKYIRKYICHLVVIVTYHWRCTVLIHVSSCQSTVPPLVCFGIRGVLIGFYSTTEVLRSAFLNQCPNVGLCIHLWVVFANIHMHSLCCSGFTFFLVPPLTIMVVPVHLCLFFAFEHSATCVVPLPPSSHASQKVTLQQQRDC